MTVTRLLQHQGPPDAAGCVHGSERSPQRRRRLRRLALPLPLFTLPLLVSLARAAAAAAAACKRSSG